MYICIYMYIYIHIYIHFSPFFCSLHKQEKRGKIPFYISSKPKYTPITSFLAVFTSKRDGLSNPFLRSCLSRISSLSLYNVCKLYPCFVPVFFSLSSAYIMCANQPGKCVQIARISACQNGRKLCEN